MNVDTKLFYTRDYYFIYRKNEENIFIQSLNSDSKLSALIDPYIQNLKNQVFESLTSVLIAEKQSVDVEKIYEEIDSDRTFNDALHKALSDNIQYKAIVEQDVNLKLLPSVFLKLYKRIFEKDGLNDEKYIISSYVQYWLEFLLAKSIVSDQRFKSYSIVISLIHKLEMLHNFYAYFKEMLPTDWVTSEKESWVSVHTEAEKILVGLWRFDGNYFDYQNELIDKYRDASPYKFTFETTRFSEQYMFSDEYSFKNSVLFEKDIDLWLQFWTNLKFPILQDLPFIYLQSPLDILEISTEIDKHSIENTKILYFILIQNLFDHSIKVDNTLEFYSDSEKLKGINTFQRNEELLQVGKDLQKKWAAEKAQVYHKVFSVALKSLTYLEIEEWLFSFKPRHTNSSYDKIYNDEIQTITNELSSLNTESFEAQLENIVVNFNLQKFKYFVDNIGKIKTPDKAKLILDSFREFLKTKDFYWDKSFSEEYWSIMKGVGTLLSLTEQPIQYAKEILNQFHVNYEGWNVTHIDYKYPQKEAFVMCCAVLLLEHEEIFENKDDCEDYFKFLTNRVIEQIRYASFQADYYPSVLFVLSLIANQVLLNTKPFLDLEMVNYIDEIKILINILASAGYSLSEEATNILKNRLENEARFEEKKLLQRGMNYELNNFKEGIKKLLPSS